VIQRFRAALTCGGYNPANPENLVKDDKGDFVLFSDVKKIKAENERLRGKLEEIDLHGGHPEGGGKNNQEANNDVAK